MPETERQSYIDGLHQIADFLAEHPEVPLPYLSSNETGRYEPVLPIFIVSGDQREQLAVIARAMGTAEKAVHESLPRFQVVRRFAGIALVASADRGEVCERVVTGTREVTREVPDAEALKAVPKVVVTEVIEDVEWRCTSLLKDPVHTGGSDG
jgi:hypothetical protein